MKNEFVSYEIALSLKELGFNEPCFTYYKNDQLSNILELVKNSEMENVNNEVDNYISAPTFSQAFRWFREKYKLDSYIKPSLLGTKKVYDFYIWFTNKEGERDLFIGMNNEYTYEEAELECLNKLIEIKS